MISFGALAFIFSLIALMFAIFSLIEVKAMQRSTHQVSILDPAAKAFRDALEPNVTNDKEGKRREVYDNL